MRYIWIIMLIIADIIWFIASLIDFIKTAKRFRFPFMFDALEEYTVWFILVHLLGLFIYSLFVFIQGMG